MDNYKNFDQKFSKSGKFKWSPGLEKPAEKISPEQIFFPPKNLDKIKFLSGPNLTLTPTLTLILTLTLTLTQTQP